MATAEELLGMISEKIEDVLVVDLNTRIITIPASLQILGVESDDDVKRLQFKVPRYCGEFDLSTFDIRINFENAGSEGDMYPIDDLAVTDDNNFITFSWLVDRSAFLYPGEVKFSICMKLLDDDGVVIKELNTAPASLPVLEGLETEKALVENNPSAFDVILRRLYAVEAATGNSQNGYYTIATINETDEGVEITLVGSDGVTVATLKDGYTPTLGTDYWTAEEQAAMRSEAQSYINSWAPTSKSLTLLASNWNTTSKTVQVTAPGVTEDNIVVIAPSPDGKNRVLYSTHCVRCIGQGLESLTFECDTIPASDIVVNVGVFYSLGDVIGGGGIIVTDDGEGNVTIL